MRDNISLRNIMFCANDELEHDVVWSRIAGGWMLENKVSGLISTHHYLCSALTAMHVITGKYGEATEFEYRSHVANQWTIRPNPYLGD